jgi:hypothetical protein
MALEEAALTSPERFNPGDKNGDRGASKERPGFAGKGPFAGDGNA